MNDDYEFTVEDTPEWIAYNNYLMGYGWNADILGPFTNK